MLWGLSEASQRTGRAAAWLWTRGRPRMTAQLPPSGFLRPPMTPGHKCAAVFALQRCAAVWERFHALRLSDMHSSGAALAAHSRRGLDCSTAVSVAVLVKLLPAVYLPLQPCALPIGNRDVAPVLCVEHTLRPLPS